MVKEKNRVVNNFLAFIDVVIAWVALDITLYIRGGDISYITTKDSLILHVFLLIVWFILSKVFRVSELYRSRPVSVLLFNCIKLSVVGTLMLVLLILFVQHKISNPNLLFCFAGISLLLTFGFKLILFSIFKNARKKGFNYRTVTLIGDKTAIPLVNKFLGNPEWGYKINALIGDDLKDYYGHKMKVLPKDTDIDKLLEEETVDELIYCVEMPDMKTVQDLLLSCNEIGVVFRMYSPIFNMLSNKTHLHYFGTTPLLTISNTPLDYLSLKIKRFIDFISSLAAVILLSPVYVIVALLIVSTSKGPVFFKQIRVGLRGRQFWLYKFRTMVTNAEELKNTIIVKFLQYSL